MPVLRWSPTAWRKAEAARDRIMHETGTDEPWYLDQDMIAEYGIKSISPHWRKPLRPDEVNQLPPTPEVRQREGRA